MSSPRATAAADQMFNTLAPAMGAYTQTHQGTWYEQAIGRLLLRQRQLLAYP